MSKPIDQERELFEAHYHLATLDRDPISGAYYDNETRCLWDAWQARASVQPEGVAGLDAQWQHIDDGDLDSAEKFINERFDPGKCLFLPADAYMLANMALHCIREVRATRAAAPRPVSGEQQKLADAQVLLARVINSGALSCEQYAELEADICAAVDVVAVLKRLEFKEHLAKCAEAVAAMPGYKRECLTSPAALSTTAQRGQQGERP